MSENKINRLVALGVFLISVSVYIATLSQTVVFWDVGEFIAASYLLQVPHPPGSPLFLLLGRVVSMVPFFVDIAARVHAISAVASALSVAFLYLITVKLISRFRGIPQSGVDRLVVFGASAVGALALAFTTTFWKNAIEAEVYGLSMFFVSGILWLALRWWERSEEPRNEKYMMLIAYLIGLSIGVHLLSLLAIFTVFMIFYFKNFEMNRINFIKLGIVSSLTFFIIYPGIVQYFPSLLDGEFKGIQSDLLRYIPFILILLAAYYTYKTTKTKQKLLHVICLSFLFIVLGYTTYIGVIIRSNVHPPMNENNPSTISGLVSYLSREQYGDTPILKGMSWDNNLQDYREKLFPRRYSQEAMHEATRVNYSSDMDFMLKYQLYHMFLRYHFWNFIGMEGDWEDAGVGWKDTYGIPFFVGLLGLYYHLRKDWKNALPFVVLFLVMGVVFALYANMQNPQPRERDYFYVGAFYSYAIWIGIGIVAIIDFVKNRLSNKSAFQTAAVGMLSLSAIAIPANLLRINWEQNDRSGNFVAWDYSYNLLQSCDPDAILFTNGDNDTFPLWYLQDVEGVRRDVRIANLSLINTSWYIDQLKNETPHGTAKVPISLTDQEISRVQPRVWKPQEMSLPVPPEVAREYGVTDSTILKSGKMTFTLNGVPLNQEVRILRVQDLLVWDIIKTNNWKRPINFAVTVSPDSKIGLDSYLWMQGLVWRFKPVKVPPGDGGLDIEQMSRNVLARDVVPSKTPQQGFRYRNINNPDVYYDENIQRLLMNYRAGFLRLAYDAIRKNEMDRAKDIMTRMEEVIPLEVVPVRDWSFAYDIMRMYSQIGLTERTEEYAKFVEESCLQLINDKRADVGEMLNPYQALLDIYETRKDYAAALGLMHRLAEEYPDDPRVKNQIQYYENLLKAPAQDSVKP